MEIKKKEETENNVKDIQSWVQRSTGLEMLAYENMRPLEYTEGRGMREILRQGDHPELNHRLAL